jgi:hypothetical protein
MGGIASTLVELSSFLEEYGFGHHAGRLRYLADIYEKDDVQRFREEVNDPSMWGGAGAMWDAGPRDGRFTDLEKANADEMRFRELVIRLVEELAKQDLASEDARARAEAFRTWNEMGL